MLRLLLFIGCFSLHLIRLMAQNDIAIIQQIDINQTPKGKITKYWLHLMDNGMSQPIYVPIFIARGVEDGPTLGMVAAIHGNELNGIPIIQQVFKQIDPTQLKGTVIGVPGINVISLNQDRRRFVDEEDLNRNFPGKEKGNRSQQYVYKITQKILPHFDYLVDMHTASFGRTNSLYVRADMRNDTMTQMAKLQDCDIILNSKGVPTITVEYGNPQVYQSQMIERGVNGMKNLMSWLKMTDEPIQFFSTTPIICRKSYWLYVDKGGLLEIPVSLTEKVKKNQVVGILRNPFGDVLQEYVAPQDGVVIGKSSNPVNMEGGRILHLGVIK